MKKIIYLTDIHSNIELLEQLPLTQPEWGDSVRVYGGDYIDGFNQSTLTAGLDVLEFVRKDCQENGSIAILGNHDDWLVQLLDDSLSDYKRQIAHHHWWMNGGQTTLTNWAYAHNYDGDVSNPVEAVVLLNKINSERNGIFDWLGKLPVMIQNGNKLFVHAGVDLGMPLDGQIRDELLWTRRDYYGHMHEVHDDFKGLDIFTGHTPTQIINHRDGGVIELPTDGTPDYPRRFLCDAGSKGNPNGSGAQLNVVVIDGNDVSHKLVKLTENDLRI